MPYADQSQKREYQRKWRADRRAKWIEENGPCRDCGSNENLQVDHIDPEKKIDHKVWSWSKERMEEELSKCQVLCEKCHVKKSIEEGTRPPEKHGSISRYRAGCRCNACRKASAQRRAATRARSKQRKARVAER